MTTLADLQRLRRQAGGGPAGVPRAQSTAPARATRVMRDGARVVPACDAVVDPASRAPCRAEREPTTAARRSDAITAGDSLSTLRRGPTDVAALRSLLRVRAAAAPAIEGGAREVPGTEIAPGLRLVTARLPVPPLPPRLAGAFDRRGAFDPLQVLFFDTETTGLAGGSGTRAFMIGAARWGQDVLEVRQLLITHIAAEAAMLAEFARWLAPDTILASFNGKSYDAPLLRTRWRLARQGDPLHGLAHIDLLHPARRRYRGRFENCRLQTIERRVLGIVREDDLPGSEAPAAWLGYLRGGSSAKLNRVTAHNRQDVATLARLLRHMAV